MSARRLKSPDELIDRLHWASTGMESLLPTEERYKQALIRYLRGKGVVQHCLFPSSNLTEAERSID
jgi:hypothetical protein